MLGASQSVHSTILIERYFSISVTKRTPSQKYCQIKSLKIQSTSEGKVKVLVAQLCLTLWDLMDCSLPGSSVHGILQARILEWVAINPPELLAIINHNSFHHFYDKKKTPFGICLSRCSFNIKNKMCIYQKLNMTPQNRASVFFMKQKTMLVHWVSFKTLSQVFLKLN